MATVLSKLAKAIDLESIGSVSLKINECKHKLEETFIYFGGQLVRINHISTGRLHYSINAHETNEVSLDTPLLDSMDFIPFIPDSGIYVFGTVPVSFQRRARKYYKKSFHPSGYTLGFMAGNNDVSLDYYRFPKIRHTFYVYNGRLYYMGHHLGRLTPTLKDIPEMLRNDVKEAMDNGLITV